MSKFESFESEDSKFHASVASDDGEIKNYDMTKTILYPNLVLETDNMPFYRIRVLSNALEKLEYVHEKVPEHYYDVYLKMNEKMMCLGMVHSDNLRSILQGPIFDSLNKYIMLSSEEKVEGIMMLALCTSPLY